MAAQKKVKGLENEVRCSADTEPRIKKGRQWGA